MREPGHHQGDPEDPEQHLLVLGIGEPVAEPVTEVPGAEQNHQDRRHRDRDTRWPPHGGHPLRPGRPRGAGTTAIAMSSSTRIARTEGVSRLASRPRSLRTLRHDPRRRHPGDTGHDQRPGRRLEEQPSRRSPRAWRSAPGPPRRREHDDAGRCRTRQRRTPVPASAAAGSGRSRRRPPGSRWRRRARTGSALPSPSTSPASR